MIITIEGLLKAQSVYLLARRIKLHGMLVGYGSGRVATGSRSHTDREENCSARGHVRGVMKGTRSALEVEAGGGVLVALSRQTRLPTNARPSQKRSP